MFQLKGITNYNRLLRLPPIPPKTVSRAILLLVADLHRLISTVPSRRDQRQPKHTHLACSSASSSIDTLRFASRGEPSGTSATEPAESAISVAGLFIRIRFRALSIIQEHGQNGSPFADARLHGHYLAYPQIRGRKSVSKAEFVMGKM